MEENHQDNKMDDVIKRLWDDFSEAKKNVKGIEDRLIGIEKSINQMIPAVKLTQESLQKHEIFDKQHSEKVELINLKLEKMSEKLQFHVEDYNASKKNKKWKFEQMLAIVAIILALAAIFLPINFHSKQSQNSNAPNAATQDQFD